MHAGSSWSVARHLEETLKMLNIDGMVVGHSVQEEGINGKCKKRVWRADTGLSSAFGNDRPVQVLEIINDGQVINVLT